MYTLYRVSVHLESDNLSTIKTFLISNWPKQSNIKLERGKHCENSWSKCAFRSVIFKIFICGIQLNKIVGSTINMIILGVMAGKVWESLLYNACHLLDICSVHFRLCDRAFYFHKLHWEQCFLNENNLSGRHSALRQRGSAGPPWGFKPLTLRAAEVWRKWMLSRAGPLTPDHQL